MKSLPKPAQLAIYIGVPLLLIFIFIGQVVSIRSTLVEKENGLTATYKAKMIELDKFTSTATETFGVSEAAADKIGAVITEAVAGRYQGADPQAQGGELFSALTEAYPDLSANTALYAKVIDVITSGRQSFADAQSKMASQVANYRTWTDSGILRPMVTSMLGTPTDRIRITIANKTAYTGEEALNVMETVIMSSNTTEAIESGVLEPLEFGAK